MDWSIRNSNGALAHPNSQQYLQQSTSSTVSTMLSQTPCIPPSSYSSAQMFVPSNHTPLLKGLLDAGSNEEILKIQMCALAKMPAPQTMQSSPGHYNSSYNPMHNTFTAANLQGSPNIQNVAVPSYQTQVYTVGYNTGEVSQMLQSTQKGGYTNTRAHQRMPNSYAAQRPSQKVQVPYWTVIQQPNSRNVNTAPNGSHQSYMASHETLNDKNVPVSTSNCQTGQNIPNLMVTNYQPVSYTNTLQPHQSTNNCVQSPQRQIMPNLHSGLTNTSNVLPLDTVGQTPPLYAQSNTNTSNVHVNQSFSNPSQNFVTHNVQQPVQSYMLPQDKHSVAMPPPPHGETVPQNQRYHMKDIIGLLKVYRNIKNKYVLLNLENILMRKQMKSTLQEYSGSSPMRPPLISTLQNKTVPTNDSMRGQEVSQNSTVQNPFPDTTHVVQTPNLYDNSLTIPIQNVTQPLQSHVYSTNHRDVLNQRSCAVLDSGQMNLGSNANSTGQAVSSETLRDQNPQASSMESIQINNQYISCGSNNGNLSKDGLHRTSVHTNTASSESCNSIQATTVGNFYANAPLTSTSREAIRATLPLWKSVPQTYQNKSRYSEPRQIVDNGFDIPLLAEIASSSVTEPTAVTLTQKSEHSGLTVSKGMELQIAIVSPLVQIKNLVGEINQHPKVDPQGKDLARDDANGVKDNDSFSKILLELESLDTTKKNLDSLSPTSSMASSLSGVEISSNCSVQNSSENLEPVDKNLKISSICTLVEGNSFYDSSIAMMFEGSSQTQRHSPLAKTDLKDYPTLHCSQKDIDICSASQATSNSSPTTEIIAIETEAQRDVEPCVKIEDNQQGADVYCHEIQPEQNLPVSDAFDLESSTVSDQLSELLTEFPFGIKNYMSENTLDSTAVCLGKFREEPEVLKTLPVACDLNIGGSIKKIKREDAVDTWTKTKSQKTESTDQQSILQRVSTPELPTPELPTDEVTSDQFEEDIFEISDNPGDNISLVLLDKDAITQIFPEDSAKSEVDSEESVASSFVKESKAPGMDAAISSPKKESSIKEKSNDEIVSAPDKKLFCCVFSWLIHTNINAPKCNCKLTELGETEVLDSNFSQPTALIKTESPAAPLESSTDVLNSSTDDLKPFPDPYETKFDESLAPAIKWQKLKLVNVSSDSKPGPPIINYCQPEKIKAKLHVSEKNLENHTLKELKKNGTLTTEKIHHSKSKSGNAKSKKSKDHVSGYKSNDDASRKFKKLIVKTDFLVNKHLHMKRKHKEMETSQFEGGSRGAQKISKNAEMGESVKTYKTDRVAGGTANNEKCKAPVGTGQQSEKRVDKLKSLSCSLDKSHSHSQDPSLGKNRGRVRIPAESHFEKVKRVPTVQEYLERKRKLCNKRSGFTLNQEDEPDDGVRYKVKKPVLESSGRLVAKLLKPLSPAQVNKTKNVESEDINPTQKGQRRIAKESLHIKHTGSTRSHGKGSSKSKGNGQTSTSSKEKIYLSPCDGSRHTSYDGISLTKLQIRCSPEKPEHYKRRKSLDSSRHSKMSKFETKNGEAPKMLEFKLCPEFVQRSPIRQEKKELKTINEKSTIEGIKSKKEAWCSGGPVKSRMDSVSEDKGCRSPSMSTSSFTSTPKNSSKPARDSRATFNAFKQMYHKQRSKSLDSGL